MASVNEGNFVAENQTDFIFAVAGEEYGFIGCTTIILLLLAIALECIRMGLRAKDLSGKSSAAEWEVSLLSRAF